MEPSDAVRALAALAQDTRLAVFRLLVQAGPPGLTVGRIGAELGVPSATLSFHLRELVAAGLVATRQHGRFVHCTANFESMRALVGFLELNCCGGEPCAATMRPEPERAIP